MSKKKSEKKLDEPVAIYLLPEQIKKICEGLIEAGNFCIYYEQDRDRKQDVEAWDELADYLKGHTKG